jgi:hypothetical protein
VWYQALIDDHFYVCIFIFSAPFVEYFPSSLNYFCNLVKICMWFCIWTFYSIPLIILSVFIQIPQCIHCSSFIIQTEILLVFQCCAAVYYLNFHTNFSVSLSISNKINKLCLDVNQNYIKSTGQFEKHQLLSNVEFSYT